MYIMRTHTRVRVYRRLIVVAYLNITRVNGGRGGGVSRRPRRAPRIEMDHKATAAADLI